MSSIDRSSRRRALPAVRLLAAGGSQLVSSLTSLVLSVVAARALNVEDFGKFAILFAAIALWVGTTRSLTSELLVFEASADEREGENHVRQSTSALIGLSAFAAVSILIVGLMVMTATFAVYLALLIPACMFHDHARYLMVAVKREANALIVDLIALAVIAAVVALPVFSIQRLDDLVLAWFFSEIIAVAVAAIWVRPMARLQDCVLWFRSRAKKGGLFLADFWATNGLTHGVIFVVALVGGSAAAAGFRAAQLLFTPVLLLCRGAILALGAEARRFAVSGNTKVPLLLSTSLTAVTVLLACATMLTVLWAPIEYLEILLGENAQTAADLAFGAGLAIAAYGFATGPGLYLRVRGRIASAATSKVVALPLGCTLVAVGVMTNGPMGALLGLAASETFRGALNWTQVRRDWNTKAAVEGSNVG